MIWGINTLFLLDAGLSSSQAFAANAAYTAGMVVFEVPTGVVADTRGRRASFLLGTLTLAAATVAYYAMWAIRGAVRVVAGGVGGARVGVHLLQRRHRGVAG